MLSDRFPVCLSCSVCDVGVLWPNGWTNPDETWHAGRPRPPTHCVRWGTSSPHPKGHNSPIFGPYLLWPTGCMDQHATWYGDRPRPRRLCVRWRPRSPQKGSRDLPIFSAMFIVAKVSNGWMEVDVGPGHTIRRGPSSPRKGHSSPPPFSAHVYCGHGRPAQLLLSSLKIRNIKWR